MVEQFKNIGEDYQKMTKGGFDATMHSFGEVNKGFQALAAEVTDYSKKTFDDAIRTWEQLMGVKSLKQAVEIQSQYAKRVYDNHCQSLEKCVSAWRATRRNRVSFHSGGSR
jgi:hypothetical protein